MVTYICIKCDKIFVNKNFYVKHLNRKFPCKKSNIIVSKITPKKLRYNEQYNSNNKK